MSFDFAHSQFRLCTQVAMEGFEDGALVLRLEDHRLFELNPVAHHILARSDGQRTAAQVADGVAAAFQISEEEALQDTLLLYERLSAEDIVEVVQTRHNGKEKPIMEEATVKSPRYIRNPDVGVREEDEDGGLLFNPDTNQVKVLNTTGLFIWQQCDGAHSLSEIVAAVQAAFEDVPADQVTQDVQEFVEGMVGSGFIGTVEALDHRG